MDDSFEFATNPHKRDFISSNENILFYLSLAVFFLLRGYLCIYLFHFA